LQETAQKGSNAERSSLPQERDFFWIGGRQCILGFLEDRCDPFESLRLLEDLAGDARRRERDFHDGES